MASNFHPSIYLSEPSHPFSEQVRSLRAHLGPLRKAGVRSFLVTSSWEGEGKSTVVINLAAAFGEIGLSVLLIDGDLRQRTTTQLLAPEPLALEWGVVTSAWLPKVALLPAPAVEPAEAANRLASSDYARMVHQTSSEYQIILIDSPPLSACADALSLGQFCDGALMVASELKFQGIPEGHYSEDLRDAGIRVFGVVLTNTKPEP